MSADEHDDREHTALESDIHALAATAQELAIVVGLTEAPAVQSRAITTLLCAALGLAKQHGVEAESVLDHLRDLSKAVYMRPPGARLN